MAKDNKTDIAGEWSDHFDISIITESTRAKVILSACYLDEILFQLLSIILTPCESNEDPLFEGPTAPLGSFSAKIEIASRMGLLSNDVRASLHLIRKIRNCFAHDLKKCDFNDSRIENWNRELHKLNELSHKTPSQWHTIYRI